MRKMTFILGLFLAWCAQLPAKRPNILLIFTDQQNIDAMSAAGNPNLSTPNMDALAKDGVRFTNAYCTSPVSGPSRASLVTGFMASEVDVDWNDNSRMKPGTKTIGHLLSESGYRTVWAGKWHVPEIYPQRTNNVPVNLYGFEFLPFWDAPSRQWLLGAETDPPLTSAVVAFLDDYSDNRPLFMAVSYHNPHDICMFPRKKGWESDTDTLLQVNPFGKYKLPEPLGIHPDSLGALPQLPPNFGVAAEPEFVIDKRTKPNGYGDEVQLAAGFTEKEWRAYLNAYYRMTELVDIEIGKVIAALKRNDLYDNTLIIFTSDHGDGMSAHKWASKLSFYEESVKVPFIMVSPNKKRNTVSETLVSLTDIVPTMCDYAGVKTDLDFAGISLRKIKHVERDYVVAELADDLRDKSRKGRMVRTQSYKYMIYSSGKGNEQLFDIVKDPGEMNNLAYNTHYNDVLMQHRRLLNEWIAKRNDNFKITYYEN